MVRTILVLAFVGCAGKNTPDGSKDEPVEQPKPAPEPAPAPEPPPVPVATPQELYTECTDRVENPQKDAECKADTDCATSGCGNEVCTTVAEKANVMTACEDKLCFKVLDACGCHEGKCSWTLKAEVPAGQVPVSPLPSSLPSTIPAKDAPNKDAEPAAPDAPKPAPKP